MALYQDGILISGANTLPKMTLAEYNALPADQRPTYWERLDADYDDVLAEKTDIAPKESGTTASRQYSVGELVYVSGILREVIAPIASGATFTEGTNVKVTNVSDALNPDKVTFNLTATSGNTYNTTYSNCYKVGNHVYIRAYVTGSITNTATFATIPSQFMPQAGEVCGTATVISSSAQTHGIVAINKSDNGLRVVETVPITGTAVFVMADYEL